MVDVPAGHPRAESLRIREMLVREFERGVVVPQGLIAQGRGEAFDYLIGEETTMPALEAIEAAAATLLLARHPVISVNGNVAALAVTDVVALAREVDAEIEVNLFHRTRERELAIKDLVEKAGGKKVLGVGRDASTMIPELSSKRRRVDPQGIYTADVVLVPLEDGDRTEALAKMGKTVIAIDLNPLSRTATQATIIIVDNVVRALPLLVKEARRLKGKGDRALKAIIQGFDNDKNLSLCLQHIIQRLKELSASRLVIERKLLSRL